MTNTTPTRFQDPTMIPTPSAPSRAPTELTGRLLMLPLTAAVLLTSACASGSGGGMSIADLAMANAPSPDPRVGLAPGLFDAGEAIWNLRRVSSTPPPEDFVGATNSDLAFKDDYAIQGNYNGIIVWDVSDPTRPSLVTEYVCPASQSDVSVYGNLLFVSGEGLGGRVDCGTEGVDESVSADRLRGIRIFDISDIRNPRYVHNVQTCRGSHTHTLLKDPDDDENVYVYVSGSSVIRPPEELSGCSTGPVEDNPNTALFRIEVIRVPIAAPEQAAIVSSPRIFAGLVAPPQHGPAPAELAEVEEARARGAFILDMPDSPQVLPQGQVNELLGQIVEARGGAGAPTAADSTELRRFLAQIVEERVAAATGPAPGPTQCHDITVYPAIGLAGGACGGYGMLIDITDPTDPVRIDAVADENFSYWHSATFSNDGSKVLFTDEWGGGGAPRCLASDPPEWGANAIFTIENRRMRFHSYYKLPAPQTEFENCVAHNGSLIPVPGRDIMVQGWYQGGISIFDWTDPARPVEIAFHDRGPVSTERRRSGGPWSVYWYNGVLVSSEIARGLDIFELTPSPLLTQNEIDAARSVRLDYLNPQGQPRIEWPATFALARAFMDQLERSGGLSDGRMESVRADLATAEGQSGAARRQTLTSLAGEIMSQAGGSSDAAKVRMLADAVQRLAAM
jgi:hypothetical protein